MHWITLRPARGSSPAPPGSPGAPDFASPAAGRWLPSPQDRRVRVGHRLKFTQCHPQSRAKIVLDLPMFENRL